MKNPTYCLLGALWAVLATAHAAPVTWSTGPTVTNDETAISLAGTLFHAGTWGTGAGSGPLTVPVGSQSVTFENMTTGGAVGALSAIATGGEFFDVNSWVPPGAAGLLH